MTTTIKLSHNEIEYAALTGFKHALIYLETHKGPINWNGFILDEKCQIGVAKLFNWEISPFLDSKFCIPVQFDAITKIPRIPEEYYVEDRLLCYTDDHEAVYYHGYCSGYTLQYLINTRSPNIPSLDLVQPYLSINSPYAR